MATRLFRLLAHVLLICGIVVYFGYIIWVNFFQYEAVSLIRVRQSLPAKTMMQHEYDTYKQTQATLVSSPFVLTDALRKPGIAQLEMLKDLEKPVDWLAEHISTDDGESELSRARLRGRDEAELVKILQAIVESYISEIASNERYKESKYVQVLRSQHQENEIQIKKEIDRIEEISTATRSTTSAQRIQESTYERANQQLAWIEEKLLEIETQALTLSKLGKGIQDHPELAARRDVLQAKRIEASEKLHLLEGYLGPVVSSDLVTRKAKVAALQTENERLAEQIGKMELALKGDPRISLVQPALIPDDE